MSSNPLRLVRTAFFGVRCGDSGNRVTIEVKLDSAGDSSILLRSRGDIIKYGARDEHLSCRRWTLTKLFRILRRFRQPRLGARGRDTLGGKLCDLI